MDAVLNNTTAHLITADGRFFQRNDASQKWTTPLPELELCIIHCVSVILDNFHQTFYLLEQDLEALHFISNNYFPVEQSNLMLYFSRSSSNKRWKCWCTASLKISSVHRDYTRAAKSNRQLLAQVQSEADLNKLHRLVPSGNSVCLLVFSH